jgi:hypothetical protein
MLSYLSRQKRFLYEKLKPKKLGKGEGAVPLGYFSKISGTETGSLSNKSYKMERVGFNWAVLGTIFGTVERSTGTLNHAPFKVFEWR